MTKPGGASNQTSQGEQEPKIHYCGACSEPIGVECERNGKPYILIGNHPALFFEGICGNCGTQIVWESPARRLDRLIERQRKARERLTK